MFFEGCGGEEVGTRQRRAVNGGKKLEHGDHDPQTDVTGGDPVMTAKIAWAHLKEMPDYYTRLAVMEAEGER